MSSDESLNEESTIREDYMVKRSLMKGRIIQYDNFKARWIRLTTYHLKWLEGSLERGAGKEKGFVALDNISVVCEADLSAIDDSPAKRHSFQVWFDEGYGKVKSPRKLYICALNNHQKKQWIDDIRQACQEMGAQLESRHHPGVWAPRSGSKFSCCGQENRDAPGCKDEFLPPIIPQLVEVEKRPLKPPTKKSSPLPVKRLNKTRKDSPGRGSPTRGSPKTIKPVKKRNTNSPLRISESSPNQNGGMNSRSASLDNRVDRVDAPLNRDLIGLNLETKNQKLRPEEPSTIAPLSPGLVHRKYVLVQFDYSSSSPDDLTITKGEKLELIDKVTERFWWQAQNDKGQIGFVPYNYVQEITTVESHPWFFPDMTRERAELILKEDGREGVFLVRPSNLSDCYTVGIFTKEIGKKNSKGETLGTVRHYHIKNVKNERGDITGFYLSESHTQPTIPEVIAYHSQDCGGLITRLRFYPHEKPPPPTVGLGHGRFLIDRKDLKFEKQLGKGNFGEVWKAKFKGSTDVAVKMTLPNLVNNYDFVAEAKLMMQLQCEHLVQLYGVVEKPDLLIVTEFMEEGALLDYLKKKRSVIMTNPNICIDLCRQVAEGMAYLESENCIHRDLAARNCLVGSSEYGYEVKVADFGLSRHVVDDEYTCSVGAKFPIRWSSPEVLTFTRFSSKSDVWAFGVLMWEVFTAGDTPYREMTRNADVAEYVTQKRRTLNRPNACPNPIYQNIMSRCWAYAPDERPNFKELVGHLNLNWT